MEMTRIQVAELFTRQRRAERARFYDHRVWRRIRAYQLKKQPLCAMCGNEGVITPASVCDHIDPTWETWKEFIKGPFQSLCAECHRVKTGDDIVKLKKAEMLKIRSF